MKRECIDKLAKLLDEVGVRYTRKPIWDGEQIRIGALCDAVCHNFSYGNENDLRIDSVNKRALWECKCECGNTCYMPSRYLLSMNVKSCGCNTKSYGELLLESNYNFIIINSKNSIHF